MSDAGIQPQLPKRDRPATPGRSEPRSIESDGGGVSTLIPYKNPSALVGYYLGVFSLIPVFGLILGPAAIVLGVFGIRYVQQYPTAKGTAHAVVALVLGTLTTLGHLVAVVLVVAAMLSLPSGAFK
jgi:hypothetical protein